MIKFLDLQKINLAYQEQFQDKMKLVLDKGWFILQKLHSIRKTPKRR